ncbi:MAG: trypsin-like peptidase domain-containing protein [Candidatus Poribacteria bacterium]|nr:trypsin-like peptidase domain-containing protein [Candidatus Poribacteria bacterium]
MEQERDNPSPQNAEEIIGTTVLLEMEYADDDDWSRGCGFFITPDKIVTNVHVLAGKATVTAKCVETETTYTIEGILAFDDINDLAVLKVVETATPFPLGDSRKVRKGNQVCLIGCPKGKVNHVEGTVDSIRNSGKNFWVKFEIPDGRGYSGSPILNAKGEVVAVVRAGDAPTGKNTSIKSYTVPSSVLKLLLNETNEVESLDAWQKRPRICAYIKSYDGYLSSKHGDIKEAIVLYDNALKLNPDLADVYSSRASAKRALAKFDEELVDSLAALKLNRERFSFSRFGLFLAWKWKVVKLSFACRWQRLIKNILGESAWFETQAQVKIRLAKMRIEKGKISEVLDIYQAIIDDFTEAINQNPSETKQKNLSTARRLYQEAIDNLTEVINQKQKPVRSYYNRGRSKYIFGEFENQLQNLDTAQKLYQSAISDYTEAINSKIKGLYTYNHRGQTKYQLAKLETKQGNTTAAQNLYQEIVSDSDKALELKEKCVACRTAIHHIRGVAKAALDDHEGAIKDFDESIHLNPNKVLYYHDRGKAKEALGQHEAAEADFTKAKELDPKIEK